MAENMRINVQLEHIKDWFKARNTERDELYVTCEGVETSTRLAGASRKPMAQVLEELRCNHSFAEL